MLSFYKDPNCETVDLIINSGTILLLDGSLDIRTEAKTIFMPCVAQSRFETIIVRNVIEKKYKRTDTMEKFVQIRKSLDACLKQQLK